MANIYCQKVCCEKKKIYLCNSKSKDSPHGGLRGVAQPG